MYSEIGLINSFEDVSVVDPKFFFSDPYPDPDPTFQKISDPDPTLLITYHNILKHNWSANFNFR